jgi:cytoskeletal protein CcmA (bactofilin family)
MRDLFKTKLGELFGGSSPANNNSSEPETVFETRTPGAPPPVAQTRQEKIMEDNTRSGDLNTIIGKGTVVEGTLKIQNSLRLDGKITGQVLTTDSLIVGKEGEIDGEVRVKNAVVGGLVKGQIFASGKVTLEARSVVTGEVKTAKLAINDGAKFEGHCVMTEEASVKVLPHGNIVDPLRQINPRPNR